MKHCNTLTQRFGTESHFRGTPVIKCVKIPFSLSFPRSFDHSGFCRVNFYFFDTNFCFKS